MTQDDELSTRYKNIIIVIGVLCLLIFILIFTTLLCRCTKKRNILKQNHISINNPVYQPEFKNVDEPSLYQDIDTNVIETPEYNVDYLEITNN